MQTIIFGEKLERFMQPSTPYGIEAVKKFREIVANNLPGGCSNATKKVLYFEGCLCCKKVDFLAMVKVTCSTPSGEIDTRYQIFFDNTSFDSFTDITIGIVNSDAMYTEHISK